MRKLIVLVALTVGAFSARAQAPAGTLVTKLPGEEKLSVRERAERDFLMPVRRKKAVEASHQPTASAAEPAATAAPENDALTTYSEAAPDPRPEPEALAENHAARASRSHAAWLAARRERLAEARRAARHSSKSKHTSKSSKSSSSKSKSKTKTRHAAEASHSKKSSSRSHRSESGNKARHHAATTKTKAKSKPTHRKRR